MTDTTEVMRASTEMSHGYHVTTAKVAMGLREKAYVAFLPVVATITRQKVPNCTKFLLEALKRQELKVVFI